MQSLPEKQTWFKMTKNVALLIFLYYVFLIGIFAFLFIRSIFIFPPENENVLFRNTILSSIYISILGASVFYIRKLYKACINADLANPETYQDKIRQLGVSFYFFLRPIFASIFSIVILFALKSGAGIMTASKSLTTDFFYVAILICFFVGYSAGDFIDRFELIGKSLSNRFKDPN